MHSWRCAEYLCRTRKHQKSHSLKPTCLWIGSRFQESTGHRKNAVADQTNFKNASIQRHPIWHLWRWAEVVPLESYWGHKDYQHLKGWVELCTVKALYSLFLRIMVNSTLHPETGLVKFHIEQLVKMLFKTCQRICIWQKENPYERHGRTNRATDLSCLYFIELITWDNSYENVTWCILTNRHCYSLQDILTGYRRN